MKKRQVMALILAAALALPNTGAFAGVVGAPVTVEAASRAAGVSVVLGDGITVNASDSMTSIKSQLVAQVSGKLKMTETNTTVADVIKVAEGWKLLNGDTKLARGEGNVAKVRYTFPKDFEVTGSLWDKDETTDLWYGDFDVEFEAVELVDATTVLRASGFKWPELKNKEFNGDATAKTTAYWKEDLASGSSSYGTFEVVEDTVAAAGDSVSVSVKLKLNPGYEFSKTDTVDGVSVTGGNADCTKTYTVKVGKNIIDSSDFEWPEVKVADGQNPAVGGEIATVYKLSPATALEGKVEFSFVKDDKTDIADTALAKGANKLKIKATIASGSAANYEIPEKDQYKDVTIDMTAPALTNVKMQQQLDGEAKATDVADDNVVANVGGAAKDVTLSVVDEWTPDFPAGDVKSDIYKFNYQWYKDGVAIPDATTDSYLVKTTAPGEYSCKVSTKFAGSATQEQMTYYTGEHFKETSKVNVTFSTIAKGTVDKGVYASDGTGYKPDDAGIGYGNLKSDIKYVVPVTGATKNATMTLVVQDKDGKDVTDTVKSMISGEANADKNQFVIMVNKGIDAGTYKFKVKVKDGSETVILTDANLECKVNKQTLTLASAQVKAIEAKLVHGASFDKHPGFEYTPADGATTDQKDAVKAINEKVKFTATEAAFKAAFAKGYFAATTAPGTAVTVTAELNENYKKNYKLDGLTALTPNAQDDKQTTTVNTVVDKKKLTLGVEDLEMVKGESLPKRTIIGKELVGDDEVTVTDGDVAIYKEGDESRTPIKNAIKTLPAGKYIISVELTVGGADAGNYDINYKSGAIVDAGAKLTIYASEHVVGFVTDGGNAIADRNVYHNNEIGTLETPVRSGYKFLGWFADRKYTTPVTASTKVTDDMVLYAKWEKTSSTSGGSEETPGTGSAVKVGTKVSSSSGTFSVTSVAANKKTVSYKAASKSAKSVTIPSSVKIKGVTYKVTRVANSAFSGCKNLTKVTIPSTVTSIGTSSFKNCTKLTSVTIPKYVKVIDASAFSGCSKLKSVTFKGTKINKIGKSAFKGIAKKSVIKVPKSKKTTYKKLLKKSGYTKTVK